MLSGIEARATGVRRGERVPAGPLGHSGCNPVPVRPGGPSRPRTGPSPSGACGLSRRREAAYPRFAEEGEAPDGSPSSLARPGRARRKAESEKGQKKEIMDPFRIPLRAVRNPAPLAQVAQG
jgi:hypothetical protein